MSDEELITLSLSAAPEAIAKSATVVAVEHCFVFRVPSGSLALACRWQVGLVRARLGYYSLPG
jgi:hypothetical protein